MEQEKISLSGRNDRWEVVEMTDEENRTYSEAQLNQQQASREALTYAQSVKGEEIYRLKANEERGKNP